MGSGRLEQRCALQRAEEALRAVHGVQRPGAIADVADRPGRGSAGCAGPGGVGQRAPEPLAARAGMRGCWEARGQRDHRGVAPPAWAAAGGQVVTEAERVAGARAIRRAGVPQRPGPVAVPQPELGVRVAEQCGRRGVGG